MAEPSLLSVVDNREESRFEARDASGAVAGIAVYRRHDDRVVVVHTEVDGALCPVVRAGIDRHPANADLTAR